MSLTERLKRRPDCTVLLGSGLLTTAGACLASIVMSPDPGFALKSLQAVITGATIAAPALISEWQLRSHERLRQEAAMRNHLVRRAMAASLARALREAQRRQELAILVPEGLREQFFEMWPSLLDRCKTDDDLVEDLFPLSLSEEQWDIVTSYYDDLTDPSLSSRPNEFRQRLATQESVAQQALARLLFRLPIERDSDEPLSLFGRQLEQLWSLTSAKAFALKLLPLYRIAFASLCSEGGVESEAIFLKGQKATIAELRELHAVLGNLEHQLVDSIRTTKEESERIQRSVRDEGEKTRQQIQGVEEVVRKAVAEAFEKAMAAGTIPVSAVLREDGQELVEQAVQELPKVAAELRQSNSPVATRNVESLLAAGEIERARVAAQSQFDRAQVAKKESDVHFAQACYDLGRINELTFKWPAALANYRQAWKLSGEQDPNIGFKLAHFTTGFCNHDEAISIYESIVQRFADPYDKAKTLINLGAIYVECHRRKDAERAFLDAVRAAVPETGMKDLRCAKLGSQALINLGILHQEEGKLEEAQKAYSDGIEALTGLAKIADKSITTDLAHALVNLADLFIDQKLYEDAERTLAVSRAWLTGSREDLDRDSRRHQGKLWDALGRLYDATGRGGESERAWKEAVSVFHGSGVTISPVLEDLEARTHVNIAGLYVREGRLAEAETSLLKAVSLFRDLSAIHFRTFAPRLVVALHNLGNVYLRSNDLGKAIAQFSERLVILKELIVNESDESKDEYLEALAHIGQLEASVGNVKKADEHLCEAEKLVGPLRDSSPETWGDKCGHILQLRALIRLQSGFPADALDLAHRAYESARDPKHKLQISEFIVEFNPQRKPHKPFWARWFQWSSSSAANKV